MAEEFFDVVNERDEVIDRRSRRDVHKHGLRHRAVHVLVFDKQGRVFLQKRSMLKDCFPGKWDSSASGHLDCGEDYDKCAVRELSEELGLTAPIGLERLFKVDACADTGQEFVWLYHGVAEGPFALNSDEIECGGWYSPEEITRWIRERPDDFASGFRLIWQKLHYTHL